MSPHPVQLCYAGGDPLHQLRAAQAVHSRSQESPCSLLPCAYLNYSTSPGRVNDYRIACRGGVRHPAADRGRAVVNKNLYQATPETASLSAASHCFATFFNRRLSAIIWPCRAICWVTAGPLLTPRCRAASRRDRPPNRGRKYAANGRYPNQNSSVPNPLILVAGREAWTRAVSTGQNSQTAGQDSCG